MTGSRSFSSSAFSREAGLTLFAICSLVAVGAV
jgi:hypothetical protein